jgi:glycosyl transferase family 25
MNNIGLAYDLSILNTFFERVFVISLRDTLERRKSVGELLYSLNIAFEFIDAVDGRHERSFSPDVFNNQVSVQNRFMPTARQMRGGEVGCALSHIECYRRVIDAGLRNCLILEDDITFGITSPCLTDLLGRIPDNWELAYLGVKNNHVPASLGFKAKMYLYYPIMKIVASNTRPAKFSSHELFRLHPRRHSSGWLLAGAHHGTHAYGITQACAQKLIDANFPVALPSDICLNEMIVSGGLNAFLSPDNIFVQKLGRDSTTGNPTG